MTDPISPAIDRVKRLLFQPFDLGKWFTIGFCAWLASLGEASMRGGFNFGVPSRDREGGVWMEEVRDFIVTNLYWIVPMAITLGVVALGIWILFTWLSSRGRFMFLHCIVLNQGEVTGPWNRFAREANSLFRFRLLLGLLGAVALVPLMGVAGVLIYQLALGGGVIESGRIIGLIATVLGLVVGSLSFFLIGKLTKDFVVPIMFLRGGSCRESWNALLPLLWANLGRFILYLLFQIVLGIAMAMIVLALVIATCCIAGCVLILPYIGTVLLLPLATFQRCYSAGYLGQFGPEYNVFAPAPSQETGIPPLA